MVVLKRRARLTSCGSLLCQGLENAEIQRRERTFVLIRRPAAKTRRRVLLGRERRHGGPVVQRRDGGLVPRRRVVARRGGVRRSGYKSNVSCHGA